MEIEEVKRKLDELPKKELIISDNIKNLPLVGSEMFMVDPENNVADARYFYWDDKLKLIWVDYLSWKKKRGESLRSFYRKRKRRR